MKATSAGWAGRYLAVNGAPFVVIGAEVHNSSSSTVDAIRRSFTTVQALGANTVLAPVAWNQFEPHEGRFDTTLIDAMVAEARALGLRLIPLWFASWKNAASTYAPSWVLRDVERFARARRDDGTATNTLTPFSAVTREMDAKAFAALLRRIRSVDHDGTVIAVQVQNEMGLLGDSRDRCALANGAFATEVPAEVIAAIAARPDMPVHGSWRARGAREVGSWADVLAPGERTDEAFMAAGFAAYTQAVAVAGRSEHDIPMFVNAWLDEESVLDGPVAVAGGKRPGDYPSGGPVIPVAAIWEALAPALDLLAPDVYVDDADPVFRSYGALRGRLFVPELRADSAGIEQMFRAVGEHRAVGVSPFGVDALRPGDAQWGPLADAYRLLRGAAAVLEGHPEAASVGFSLVAGQEALTVPTGDITMRITALEWRSEATVMPSFGVAVVTGHNSCFVIGRGLRVELASDEGIGASFATVTLLDLEEGKLAPVLHLNGDQTSSGQAVLFAPYGDQLLEQQEIPIRLPSTGIAHLEAIPF